MTAAPSIHPFMSWRRAAVLAAICAIGAVGGCRRDPADAASANAAPVQQSKQDAALTASLSIDRTALSTAQRASFVIETSLKEGFKLRPIEVTSLAGTEWNIRSGPVQLPRAAEGGRSTQRAEYTLEPLGPGEVELPAITLQYLPNSGDEASVRTVSFDPVKFIVTSVLSAEDSGEELSAAKSIVDPGEEMRRWIIGGAGAAAALIAGMLLIWLYAKRRREVRTEVIRRAAHELALERFERLLGADLVQQGRFKEFYRGLSYILRQYIEDRFGLHAPDRTTEEFLAEVRSPVGPAANVLGAGDVEVLGRFLMQSDLVKFAEHIPDPGDIAEVVRTVREFIESTRAPDHLVEVKPGDADAGAPGERNSAGAVAEVAA